MHVYRHPQHPPPTHTHKHAILHLVAHSYIHFAVLRCIKAEVSLLFLPDLAADDIKNRKNYLWNVHSMSWVNQTGDVLMLLCHYKLVKEARS